MSPMETRPAGAARGVDQGRKWGEERRKATGKTVQREFSGKVLGWGNVQRASGGGRRMEGLARITWKEKALKKKKTQNPNISAGRKILE